MLKKEEMLQTINIWKSMPRNNVDEMALADRYFDEVLMPISLDMFMEKEGNNPKCHYDGMVLTLGTSWQPLALSISVLKPKKILIMGTEDTEKYFVQLKKFLGRECEIITWKKVDRANVEDIYAVCTKWLKENLEITKVGADITGGTKAMVAGLAMYAAKAKWDIFYVESKYLPLYRRPEPGSEMLIKLQLP